MIQKSMLFSSWAILISAIGFFLCVGAQQPTQFKPSPTGPFLFNSMENLNAPRESQQNTFFFMVSTTATSTSRSFFTSVSSNQATRVTISTQTTIQTTLPTITGEIPPLNRTNSLVTGSSLKRSTHTATAYFVDTLVVPAAYNTAQQCSVSYLFILTTTILLSIPRIL
ncbi:hypothetical protein K7432_007463 [Basidiobolus ranarum]|uniref:Uncharacterized protein n=1 Tax=Basidiobolus ranarum TaxID=34480 RepID=A0ABR2W041_9FUNG